MVARAPSSLALIDGADDRRWSRAELAATAEAWRAALPAPEKLARRPVLMAEPNGAGWFRVFLGLLAADAVPVPCDAAEPPAQLEAMARAIGAAAVWHQGRLKPVDGTAPRRLRNAGLLKLTSGSTGTPKPLRFTHGQMLADGRQICTTMGIGPDDVNLAAIPLGHSYGLGNLVVPLLAQGTAVACAMSPLPQALAQDCARWRPTVFPAVPTLLQAMVRSAIEPAQLASLRLVISAGAPLSPAVAAQFADQTGHRVHSFYGTSETGGIAYDRSGEATLAGRSVGAPLEGVRVTFRRSNRFVVESAAVKSPGLHAPPDFAEINDSGELVLLGRSGRIVKIAGRRLNLSEVEATLAGLPGVRAAFAMPHPRQPDRIAAVVETELTPAALRAALTVRTAAWKIPDRLVATAEMPVSARGKIDRRRAAALLEEVSGTGGGLPASRK